MIETEFKPVGALVSWVMGLLGLVLSPIGVSLYCVILVVTRYQDQLQLTPLSLLKFLGWSLSGSPGTWWLMFKVVQKYINMVTRPSQGNSWVHPLAPPLALAQFRLQAVGWYKDGTVWIHPVPHQILMTVTDGPWNAVTADNERTFYQL
jgi:hypothetical protein